MKLLSVKEASDLHTNRPFQDVYTQLSHEKLLWKWSKEVNTTPITTKCKYKQLPRYHVYVNDLKNPKHLKQGYFLRALTSCHTHTHTHTMQWLLANGQVQDINKDNNKTSNIYCACIMCCIRCYSNHSKSFYTNILWGIMSFSRFRLNIYLVLRLHVWLSRRPGGPRGDIHDRLNIYMVLWLHVADKGAQWARGGRVYSWLETGRGLRGR